MKRNKLTLILGLVFVLALPFAIRASQNDLATLGYDTPNGRDVWRVNSSGTLLPGADNTYAIGADGTEVSGIFAEDLTLDDDLTVADDATITDDLTVSDDATVSGDLVVTLTAQVDGNSTLGSNNADVLDLNVGTITINAQSRGIAISSHSGAGEQTMVIDGFANRVCIACNSTQQPEEALQVLGDGFRVGTGSTPDVTLGADDAFIEDTLEVDGAVRVDGAADFNSTVDASAGYLQIYSRTLAQIQAITPTAAGQMYYCSNCTATRICISTGTSVAQFGGPDGTGGCS